MRSVRQITLVSTAGMLGLCALGSCFQPRAAVVRVPHSTAPPPRSPAAVALRRAEQLRTRAKLAASEKRGELEAWDPQASDGLDADEWRLQQLAMDRDGNLHEARRWAEQAAHLARTRAEAYQAAELQVLLDHEMGDHEAELRRARTLIALASGSPRARMVLRRAEGCYRRLVGRAGGSGSPPPMPK
jgi:hypothetical protein